MAETLDIPQFRDAARSHPLPIRAVNRIGRLWPESRRRLSAEAIWADARKGTLADCEPTPEAREALEVLVDSLRRNVRMNLVGWISAKDDTTRMARTHLRIHRELETRPEIRNTVLPPAIFIVGWPRTGTTFLHQLLACDPESRTMPYWESFDPVAPAEGEPDRRQEKLSDMLGMLARIEPRYNAIHPMEADSVEECVALFMNEFRTLQFDFQYRVPEYARWMLEQDANIAYDLYERQLELVQFHRPAGVRQVLKDPTHLIHLSTLVERFPNAQFIFTHRDPAFAISSVCSLMAYTRALFTDEVDPRALAPEVLAGYWPTALEASRKICEKIAPGRAVDVRHPDLARDPLGTVESIYAALGLSLSDAAREAMERFLAVRAESHVGRHEHALEGFGSTREEVRERFADYCLHFDL